MASSFSRIKPPSSLAKTSAGLKARQSYADRVAKALNLRPTQKTRFKNFMAVVPAATFRKWYLKADVPTRQKMIKSTALTFEADMGNIDKLKTRVTRETLKKVSLNSYNFFFGRPQTSAAQQKRIRAVEQRLIAAQQRVSAQQQRRKAKSQKPKPTATKPKPSPTRTQMAKKPTSLKAMYTDKKSKKTKVYPFYIVGPTIKTIPGVKAKSFTKRSLRESRKRFVSGSMTAPWASNSVVATPKPAPR